MITIDLGFDRKTNWITTYSSYRDNDIKLMKERYVLTNELQGSNMDHYVIVGGVIYNGFTLKEAKKILGVK